MWSTWVIGRLLAQATGAVITALSVVGAAAVSAGGMYLVSRRQMSGSAAKTDGATLFSAMTQHTKDLHAALDRQDKIIQRQDETIQKQNDTIRLQANEIGKLQNRITVLEARVEELEVGGS